MHLLTSSRIRQFSQSQRSTFLKVKRFSKSSFPNVHDAIWRGYFSPPEMTTRYAQYIYEPETLYTVYIRAINLFYSIYTSSKPYIQYVYEQYTLCKVYIRAVNANTVYRRAVSVLYAEFILALAARDDNAVSSALLLSSLELSDTQVYAPQL